MESKTLDQLVVRTIAITKKTTDQSLPVSRKVSHFQYLGWPDQGLPPNTDGFRKLIDMVDPENSNNSPIVVHCSAGIGRTGTFCLVHCTVTKLRLLLSASLKGNFNVKESLLRMREERAGMVQTKEQYVFVYMSLVDKLSEILKLLEYKNEKWFHKNLDSNQTTQMLSNKPHGTFMFRASSVPGYIVLSAVSGKNILHARVAVTDRGFQLEDEVYLNLTAMVSSRRNVLIHPILHK